MGEAAESSDSGHSDSDRDDSRGPDDRTLEDRVDDHETDAAEHPPGKILKFTQKSSYQPNKRSYQSKPSRSDSNSAQDENPDSIESRLESKYTHKAHSDSKESKRTIHGAVAIIYYTDPETGRTFFFMEENKEDYALPQYRNKLRFIGGAEDTTDKDRYETLTRELGEEVASKTAKHILIENAASKPYARIHEHVNGEIAETDVYLIKLNSRQEWDDVSTSLLTHDAGYARILSLEELMTMGNDSFAFNQGPLIKQFTGSLVHGSKSHHYSANPENTLNLNAYKPANATLNVKPLEFKIAA